jgi:hypothetical protein
MHMQVGSRLNLNLTFSIQFAQAVSEEAPLGAELLTSSSTKSSAAAVCPT